MHEVTRTLSALNVNDNTFPEIMKKYVRTAIFVFELIVRPSVALWP